VEEALLMPSGSRCVFGTCHLVILFPYCILLHRFYMTFASKFLLQFLKIIIGQ